MIKTLLLSIFLCVNIGLFAQKYSFVTYSTEQGLPQSQVTSINQDKDGYLWIGTLGGLAKFNGSKFTTYSTNDGLLNNRVRSIALIEDELWIGHDGGISFIKNDSIKSVEFSGDGNDRSRNVSKILKFRNQIYVCSNGGGLFKLQNNRLQKIPLKSADFEKIREAVVYDNQLFLATRDGVLSSDDGKSFHRVKEYGDASFSGICVRGNQFIASTFSQGIFIKNLKTGKTKYIDGNSLIHSVYGCYIDSHGLIWLTTLNGIIQINLDGEIDFLNESNGLPLNMLGCFFEDADGNLWIGSQGKGLFRYPGKNITYYDQSTGYPSDLFLTGFQDEKGDYYFGTLDAGIINKTKEGTITPLPVDETTIWASLKNVAGSNWFGAESALIEVNKNGQITYHSMDENDQIPGTKISALYKVTDSKMYIGGNKGVSVFENGKFRKLIREDATEIGTVRDFEIVDGVLYCVSNLGLMQYSNQQFEVIDGAELVVYNLEKDDNNVLWFGTEEGLFKYKDGKIFKFQLLNDPASNYIDFLNFYNKELYVGTNNGLFIISGLDQDKVKIKRFGVNDGLIDLETNLNSGFFDNQHSFWFGTASGLVKYTKNEAVKRKSNPKVNLTDILLNYQKFDYSKYATNYNHIGFPKELILPYSKNSLTFEIDGISLGHHEGVSFQYWLEGLTDSWSSLSKNTTITFSSLPAGDYLLHVRAVDIEGVSSEEINYPFTINAAFYNTWWFYLIIALLIAGITIAFFQFRLKRIAEKNEKDKLKYKSRLLVLEQQSMNASMNRHFIFNSLNSIQYFINTQDRFSANKYLTNFAKLIRKNLDSATTPGNIISLEDELERIKLYLSLESMRFKDRFDYEVNINGVDTESEFIPAMIMQPFIENSIIHGILPNESRKGKIVIDIQQNDGFLEIKISDNGIGIEQSLSKKSTMDGDHKSQGMVITSKRIELLQKISSNNISLEGPIQITDENGLINGTYVLIKIPCENLVD